MAKLAMNGGTPAVTDWIPTTWPIYDDREKKALIDVLESGKWCCTWSLEGKVGQFGQEFADYIGTKYGTCVNSGTSALNLAFRVCDIEPGDEIIVTAVSFIASASAIVLAGGVPVFVDVDPETYQMSPDAVEAAITDRTRVIEVVHYGGYPVDMDRIGEIARKHNLLIVEDCAEAHGTEWKGKKTGSLGDIGAFSFQMGKNLTCGDGGAVTYSKDEMAVNCFAHSRYGSLPDKDIYVHHVPAGNYRMSEFVAAILSVQLSRHAEQTQIRYENGEYFAQELGKIGGISALKREPRITKRGYYFYFLRYDSSKWADVHRNKFRKALAAEGVSTGTAHNDPLYMNPAFKNIKKSLLHGNDMDYTKVHCPEAERIYDSEVIALGKDFLMERENVDKTLSAIHKLKENLDELSKSG